MSCKSGTIRIARRLSACCLLWPESSSYELVIIFMDIYEAVEPKGNTWSHMQVKDMQFKREFGWGGTQIKVWFGKVEGLPVYFLEPQNG